MSYAGEVIGPMNGPTTEKEPELKIEAHFESFPDDSKYRAERKADIEARDKKIAAAIKSLTPEKAYEMVKDSLEREAKQCKIQAMEYEDDESVSDAFDDDEDDQADGKK